MEYLSSFITIWIKFFFLFTPFFGLTMFLSMTPNYSEKQRRRLALSVIGGVCIFCFALYFFGNFVFALLGITVDGFRAGAGLLLLLSAISLTQSKTSGDIPNLQEDIAFVPLAMPIIVGPGTIGTLLVLGSEMSDPIQKGIGCLALLTAILCLGIILFLGSSIERILGRKGLNILSKITGLILAAMAAQMILTGACNIAFLMKK